MGGGGHRLPEVFVWVEGCKVKLLLQLLRLQAYMYVHSTLLWSARVWLGAWVLSAVGVLESEGYAGSH